MNERLRNGLILVGFLCALAGVVALLYGAVKLLDFIVTPVEHFVTARVLSSTLLVTPLWVVFEFAAGFGILSFFVLRRLSGRHNPQGGQVSTTHIWVDAGTGRQVMPASVRQAYEKEHGTGSWQKKVAQEQRSLAGIGIHFCYILAFAIVLLKGQPLVWAAAAAGMALLAYLLSQKMAGLMFVVAFVIVWPWLGAALFLAFLPAVPQKVMTIHLYLHLALVIVLCLALLVVLGSMGYNLVRKKA